MSKPFAFAILVGLFISPNLGNAQFFDVTWGASMDSIAKSMDYEIFMRSDSTIVSETLGPEEWQSLEDILNDSISRKPNSLESKFHGFFCHITYSFNDNGLAEKEYSFKTNPEWSSSHELERVIGAFRSLHAILEESLGEQLHEAEHPDIHWYLEGEITTDYVNQCFKSLSQALNRQSTYDGFYVSESRVTTNWIKKDTNIELQLIQEEYTATASGFKTVLGKPIQLGDTQNNFWLSLTLSEEKTESQK